MYKYILERAGDIDWMGIIPLLLFTTVFVIITIRAITAKKDFMNRMANLPLEENDSLKNENTLL